MASVVISLIIFAVVVIHLADIPNKVSVTSLNLDAASLPECSWQEWRLPQNVTPTAYDVALETNMQEPYQVNGTVKITLQVLQPTLCVVLHATAMNITHASLLNPHTDGGWAVPPVLDASEILLYSLPVILHGSDCQAPRQHACHSAVSAWPVCTCHAPAAELLNWQPVQSVL